MLAGRLPQWLLDGLPGLFGRCQELRSVLGGVAGGRGDVRTEGGRGALLAQPRGPKLSPRTPLGGHLLSICFLQCLPEG